MPLMILLNVLIVVIDFDFDFVEYRLSANKELTVLWIGAKHDGRSTVPLGAKTLAIQRLLESSKCYPTTIEDGIFKMLKVFVRQGTLCLYTIIIARQSRVAHGLVPVAQLIL